MPSSDISALDKGAPFIKLPISSSLAVVHFAFFFFFYFGERSFLIAPLLYFCSSMLKSLAVAVLHLLLLGILL